ncbi:MAG: restriction endonuclease subunit S [Propionivibrio sp.]|uniref:Restriction endonuclease subunit S n=1 Tax=Candidatus Propionivibrio dominans TaxID=2954373 RepID=A0A9D7FAD3_9RHOO|nr:restriction endonuclease subunit S [Candidatus Propionivibrio dominans]
MSSFSKGKIGDLLTFQRGFDITKKEQTDGIYPVVSSGGVASYHNKFMAIGPGVVIGRKGTLGSAFYLETDYWPHDTTLWVKDFKGNDPKFIYYFLKTLRLERLDSGSSNPTLNRNFVHQLDANKPEPKEQKEIAAVLSALDAKIVCNNRINAELEAMAKTLYDYWFVQFDFPDANGKPYKSTGGEMVYNSTLKREIPAGWMDGSLWEIARYFNGLAMQKHRPAGSEYLPVIKIKEMGEGISDSTEKASPDIPRAAIVNDGDVLFSWSATLDVKIWSQGKGALNQHIFKVTSDKYPKTFYYFELLGYLAHFKMMAEKRKTTMGHITQDHLKQSRICIPPTELLFSPTSAIRRNFSDF